MTSVLDAHAASGVGTPRVLRVAGMRKQYPGTVAVNFGPDDELQFRSGTIHALVGENGAGKSTLVGMIAGVTRPTSGAMSLQGRPYAPRDVVDARRLGVDIVLQEPALVDNMTVEENLLLGRESSFAPHWAFLPSSRSRLARSVLAHVQRRIPLNSTAGTLSLEDQKFVELARALSQEPAVLVIDEMTANLSEVGTEELFSILRSYAAAGGIVLYISHYLEEVFQLCDLVTVMKDGRIVATLTPAETTEDALSTLMVGRAVRSTMFREDWLARTDGENLLEVENLSVVGHFRDVSLSLHRGEVLGVGGLIGCGSETLALAVFGAVRPSTGVVRVRGRPVRFRSPSDAIAASVGLVPGDREREGLILQLALDRNIGLPSLPWLHRLSLIGPWIEARIARRLMAALTITARSPSDAPMNLSGGNRQKVVLSKWLTRDMDVLIMHNPTRGVDVGGKAEIYRLIRDLASRGAGILLITDEMSELIGLSDTIVIMRDGSVSGRVSRSDRPTEEGLIGYML